MMKRIFYCKDMYDKRIEDGTLLKIDDLEIDEMSVASYCLYKFPRSPY